MWKTLACIYRLAGVNGNAKTADTVYRALTTTDPLDFIQYAFHSIDKKKSIRLLKNLEEKEFQDPKLISFLDGMAQRGDYASRSAVASMASELPSPLGLKVLNTMLERETASNVLDDIAKSASEIGGAEGAEILKAMLGKTDNFDKILPYIFDSLKRFKDEAQKTEVFAAIFNRMDELDQTQANIQNNIKVANDIIDKKHWQGQQYQNIASNYLNKKLDDIVSKYNKGLLSKEEVTSSLGPLLVSSSFAPSVIKKLEEGGGGQMPSSVIASLFRSGMSLSRKERKAKTTITIQLEALARFRKKDILTSHQVASLLEQQLDPVYEEGKDSNKDVDKVRVLNAIKKYDLMDSFSKEQLYKTALTVLGIPKEFSYKDYVSSYSYYNRTGEFDSSKYLIESGLANKLTTDQFQGILQHYAEAGQSEKQNVAALLTHRISEGIEGSWENLEFGLKNGLIANESAVDILKQSFFKEETRGLAYELASRMVGENRVSFDVFQESFIGTGILHPNENIQGYAWKALLFIAETDSQNQSDIEKRIQENLTNKSLNSTRERVRLWDKFSHFQDRFSTEFVLENARKGITETHFEISTRSWDLLGRLKQSERIPQTQLKGIVGEHLQSNQKKIREGAYKALGYFVQNQVLDVFGAIDIVENLVDKKQYHYSYLASFYKLNLEGEIKSSQEALRLLKTLNNVERLRRAGHLSAKDTVALLNTAGSHPHKSIAKRASKIKEELKKEGRLNVVNRGRKKETKKNEESEGSFSIFGISF